jgi:hypothetical protein
MRLSPPRKNQMDHSCFIILQQNLKLLNTGPISTSHTDGWEERYYLRIGVDILGDDLEKVFSVFN